MMHATKGLTRYGEPVCDISLVSKAGKLAVHSRTISAAILTADSAYSKMQQVRLSLGRGPLTVTLGHLGSLESPIAHTSAW